MATYPDTGLRTGQQDPPYGGAAANDFGGQAWAYHDAVLQEAQKELIGLYWQSYEATKVLVSSSGVAGDFLYEYLSGSTATYTLVTAAALASLSVAYDANLTPRRGMLAEPVSAGNQALMITNGLGIPPSVHGLGPGTPGKVIMVVATGRLALSTGGGGEKIVGTINAKGYVFLAPTVYGVIE